MTAQVTLSRSAPLCSSRQDHSQTALLGSKCRFQRRV